MAKLNVAPTKSNLLAMKEQLAVSTNGYELLEEKREILVRELMHLVEKVKLLERDIDKVTTEITNHVLWPTELKRQNCYEKQFLNSKESLLSDSNQRPRDYKSRALAN